MRIYIATVSREAMPIDINDTAKVSDLKKEITARMPNFKSDDQVLKFQSKVLLDANTIKKSGITENAAIELLTARKNTILVKMTTDNKSQEIEVDFTKTGDVLKNQITQLLNIPGECQRLFTGELYNKDILSNKMITPGATIHLCVNEPNIKLNLVLHTKSSMSFPTERIEVPKGYKISQIKELIAVKWKIPCAHQSLSYNGQILENKKTIADYNIQNNMSNIIVKPIMIEIFIDISSLGRNHRMTVHVLLTETIEVVKKKIQSSLKIDIENQNLIWNGTLLNNRDILIDLEIESGSTLKLIPIIQLFKINIAYGLLQDITIETHLNELIFDLKKKIQLVTNVLVEQQILIVAGCELQNDKKLFDYNIKDSNSSSSVIMQRRDTFELRVETSNGFVTTVHVNKNDPIRYVRHQLAQMNKNLGVLTPKYAISFRGVILRDDTTLAVYGIVPGSTLNTLGIL